MNNLTFSGRISLKPEKPKWTSLFSDDQEESQLIVNS